MARTVARILLPAALLFLAAACSSGEHPVRVRATADGIDVYNADPDYEARFLVFQRRGAETAYGVYAAHGAKSRMLVPPPLDGDPVAWPERDHAEALAYLLALTGTELGDARARVAREEEAWFREGLRVFVLAPGTLRVFELDARPGPGRDR